MAGYTKLFGRILDSTIWREEDTVRILWITMLALADQNGIVESTIPGLADRARITLQQCETALERFQQPDKYSWSKEDEGRRIRVVDGGWFVINHGKYRALFSAEDRKEKTRLRVERWRLNHPVTIGNAVVTPSNASNDKQKQKQKQKQIQEPLALRACKNGTRIPPEFKVSEELRQWAKKENLPSPDLHIAEFIDYWISAPGSRGVKLDWNATFRNWLRRALPRNGYSKPVKKQVPMVDAYELKMQEMREAGKA